jgi:hypothetical protein
LANYKTAFGSFLKTEDLQGKACRLVIEAICNEEINGDHGKEKKLVARFAGKDKGLVLNRTNADSIAEIAGSEDTDDWAGVQIVLFPDKTKFGGKTVDCVRVRAPQANGAAAKPVPAPAQVEDEFDSSDVGF